MAIITTMYWSVIYSKFHFKRLGQRNSALEIFVFRELGDEGESDRILGGKLKAPGISKVLLQQDISQNIIQQVVRHMKHCLEMGKTSDIELWIQLPGSHW